MSLILCILLVLYISSLYVRMTWLGRRSLLLWDFYFLTLGSVILIGLFIWHKWSGLLGILFLHFRFLFFWLMIDGFLFLCVFSVDRILLIFFSCVERDDIERVRSRFRLWLDFRHYLGDSNGWGSEGIWGVHPLCTAESSNSTKPLITSSFK